MKNTHEQLSVCIQKIARWAYNRNWHVFLGRAETQACGVT